VAGTTGGGRGKRRGMITGINVTPMVDVVLVLLVIMMVSATFIVSRSLGVELPGSRSSDGPAPRSATVTVAADGSFAFGDDRLDADGLGRALSAAARQGDELTLVVRGDREARHGAVVTVMDLARRASITKIAVEIGQESR